MSDVAFLKGELVTLWPYVRGRYARDILYKLWYMIESEGGTGRLFWGQQVQDEALRGDLPAFVETAQQRLVLIVQDNKDQDLAGLFWFEDWILKQRATISVYMRKQSRGPAAREAMKIALRYAYEIMDVSHVWGLTPFVEACRYAERCGFKHLCDLPGLAIIKGTPHDVHVLRAGR